MVADRLGGPSVGELDADAFVEPDAPVSKKTDPAYAHDVEVRGAGFAYIALRMPSIYGKLLRRCYAVSPLATITMVVGILCSETLTAVGLLATKDVLTDLLAGGQVATRLAAAAPDIALVLAAVSIRVGLREIVMWNSSRLMPQLQLGVQRDVLHSTTSVDLQAFDDPEFRDVLHRVRARSPEAACGLLYSGLELASGTIGLLAVGGVVTYLHPALLPIMALAIVPTWLASVATAKMTYGVYTGTSGSQRQMDTLAELMADRKPAVEIRAYAMAEFLQSRFDTLADNVQTTRLASENKQAIARIIGIAVSGIGVAMVYVCLTLLLINGAMPLAVAGTAIIAIQTAIAALSGLSASANIAYENSLFYLDYLKFLADARLRLRSMTGSSWRSRIGKISLRGVGFAYPSGSPVLDGIDLDVEPGQVIALVGGNGAGKTTLSKIIAGLYHPDCGNIYYGGISGSDVDPLWLRENIAVVPQDFARWPLTVRENITVGRDLDTRVADNWVNNAFELSGADSVASKLPHGLATILDPSYVGGTELSGGQWQRLAIARGLYRSPEVLIVDEPTAALDAPTERAIFDSIRDCAGERTVVLITHRLAGVRFADQIIVLDGGRVSDRGTHAELLERGGIYSQFYRLQADLYEED
ncbi:ABC transporter ATP-binding protein [Nocardia fluminea]|uniref:ABC transporter ATP-binding protein n=1 Tax=Nocardia fluminea TaxID=134984 RepID=UPI0034041302